MSGSGIAGPTPEAGSLLAGGGRVAVRPSRSSASTPGPRLARSLPPWESSNPAHPNARSPNRRREDPLDIARQKRSPTKKRLLLGGGILGGALAITLGLSRLSPAAPTVERSTVWIDTVKRGPMLRQVRGPGTLVPEQIRWITNVTAGRVERILVEPGTPVEPETVLLELSNPDVQLEALEAQRQLAVAEAEYLNRKATHETQMLANQATESTVEAEYLDARRRA